VGSSSSSSRVCVYRHIYTQITQKKSQKVKWTIFFFSKKKVWRLFTYSPFRVSSPAEKRRYVFLSHAINPIRVGKSLPSTQSIYTHTHTLSFVLSFFLWFGLSHGSGLQYLWTTKKRAHNKQISHTMYTHTHIGSLFFLFLSLPPCSTVWKKEKKSPDNQIYIKWRTMCVGTNRLTSSFFTLNGSLLSNFFLFFFLFLSINRMFIQAAKPLRVCVLNNGRW
jgi:hypothetical protein